MKGRSYSTSKQIHIEEVYHRRSKSKNILINKAVPDYNSCVYNVINMSWNKFKRVGQQLSYIEEFHKVYVDFPPGEVEM